MFKRREVTWHHPFCVRPPEGTGGAPVGHPVLPVIASLLLPAPLLVGGELNGGEPPSRVRVRQRGLCARSVPPSRRGTGASCAACPRNDPTPRRNSSECS